MRWPILVLVAALSGCSASQNPGSATASGAETDDERRAYQRTVGGLAAGYLFQTHVSIGATADLLGKRIYDPEDAETSKDVEALMDTTIGLGENVGEMLQKLKTAGLGPGDSATIDRMLEINRLLGMQANALKVFAKERTEQNARVFDRHRRSTWSALRGLLKIRIPDDTAPLE